MKNTLPLLALLLILAIIPSPTAKAQPTTFFFEDCGNSTPSSPPYPSPADYTGWRNYGIGNIAFSGNTDLRQTNYDNSHVWFAAATISNPSRTFEISGINTSETENISLSFKIVNAGSNTINIANYFTVTCKDANNTTYPISLPTITGVQHQWVTVSNLHGIPKTNNLKIIFTSNGNTGGGFRLDDITLSGTETPNFTDLKITTWNVDWLSCTNPEISQKDRELQINNVVSVIKTMNSDLVALQEVGTSNSYATINILLQQLGSEWAGNIVPWSNDNCSQNQAIVYKRSKINVINASLITNGGSSYNWSNGRFPALYNVNLTVGNAQIPVSFINIHAKALSDEASYARRRDASIGLKNLLDGNTYNTKNLVVIGDFNDYLTGTHCTTCGGVSPYKNFMDDAVNYKGLTTTLTHPYYSNAAIDNVIISNELFDVYLHNSAGYEYSATQTIPNYRTTTSTHYPVSVTFRVTEELNIVEALCATSLQVYPNPTTGELIIDNGQWTIDNVEVFDVYGRAVGAYPCGRLKTTINISHLSAGIYFVKIRTEQDEVVRKVVKE